MPTSPRTQKRADVGHKKCRGRRPRRPAGKSKAAGSDPAAVFEFMLTFIHQLIGADEDVVEGGVTAADKIGHTHCDDDRLFGAIGRIHILIEAVGEGGSVVEVIVLEEDDDLVAADAEDGAMLEVPANNHAGVDDELVASFVTESIVHFFEPVNIEDRDREVEIASVLDIRILF